MPKTVYYASTGPDLTLYEVDVDGAALVKRGTVTLPENIQYAWAHPSRPILYVVSSNGGPSGLVGDTHCANSLSHRSCKRSVAFDRCDREIADAADPRQRRSQRRISADGVQRAEQRDGAPSQFRRHHWRAGGSGQAQHRHLRPSNTDRTDEQGRGAGDARQRREAGQARRSRARSRHSRLPTAL